MNISLFRTILARTLPAMASSDIPRSPTQYSGQILCWSLLLFTVRSPSEAPTPLKYMSIVRDSAWKSGNQRFYDESFHKLREAYLLPWDRLIQGYGLRHTMLLGQELELPFLPNMASLIPPRLLLQILLCANAVVAQSSTPVSNVGVVTQFPIAPDSTRAKVKPN